MATKKHILIIEDDPFLGDILCQKLKHEEFDVTLAVDGAQGLQQMGALKPDLVLLDIILPTMNGYEILEARQKESAAAATTGTVSPPKDDKAQSEEIARLKDELAKANAELERIKRRLAQPKP